ncbi:hypothetical protein ACHAXA_011519 [Cyclostephanos tholiformis]|uniref:Peptidase S54 rhomboid domain-containing protein n=1 Tax=Cyclostephanos tholiformis TaxID=382380 RepID=A0ABD3RTI6_9STRA
MSISSSYRPPHGATPTRKPTSLAASATTSFVYVCFFVYVVVVVVAAASSSSSSSLCASASSPTSARSWWTMARRDVLGIGRIEPPRRWMVGSSKSSDHHRRIGGGRIRSSDRAEPTSFPRGGRRHEIARLRGLFPLWGGGRDDADIREMARQKIHQLEGMQRQKIREVRGAFRNKQAQFQDSMYRLNSRINPSFPRPPYSMWRLDPNINAIGKSTLTGNIFLLNIAVFGLQTLYPRLTSLGAKRSDLILNGRQLHRLVTPIFLHGGLGHLLANGYSLRGMGNNVERAFGPERLMATYLASGVAGNVVSSVMSPNPAVGASGAIFGLVGAYYTFLARNRELFGRAGEVQKGALIETIGLNLLLGMTNPMIDNWGHIGGFVGGVGMAYLIGPKLYVARIPLGGGGVDGAVALFGAGGPGVVIDRPTLAFRTPAFVDGGLSWMADNARALGGRARACLAGMFNGDGGGRGDREYYYDGVVNYKGMGGDARDCGGGDGTIYRVLRDDIKLDGSVIVGPSDGFRQEVPDIDPIRIRQSEVRKCRKAPRDGRSIRPMYGHLYR